jgi:hypothetical protein
MPVDNEKPAWDVIVRIASDDDRTVGERSANSNATISMSAYVRSGFLLLGARRDASPEPRPNPAIKIAKTTA